MALEIVLMLAYEMISLTLAHWSLWKWMTSASWYPRPRGVFKLSFEVSALGHLGLTKVGGIIWNDVSKFHSIFFRACWTCSSRLGHAQARVDLGPVPDLDSGCLYDGPKFKKKKKKTNPYSIRNEWGEKEKRKMKREREKEEAECNALTPQDIILSALGPFHLHGFKTRHAC